MKQILTLFIIIVLVNFSFAQKWRNSSQIITAEGLSVRAGFQVQMDESGQEIMYFNLLFENQSADAFLLDTARYRNLYPVYTTSELCLHWQRNLEQKENPENLGWLVSGQEMLLSIPLKDWAKTMHGHQFFGQSIAWEKIKSYELNIHYITGATMAEWGCSLNDFGEDRDPFCRSIWEDRAQKVVVIHQP
ncbi:MAG: hypothetical protein MK212_09140 [Saprospiraceae bacterium]|nr:hypothetical protein [Saprospiraceae bacterium]